tara:strand:+ start:1231 stop:2145 length:915 start_codon:yes stop_codon:yes gene_type:complete
MKIYRMVVVYRLNDYEELNNSFELSKDTIDVIENLKVLYAKSNDNNNNNRRRRNGRRHVEYDPNFKSTVLEVREKRKTKGFESLMIEIRSDLNKLTKDTFSRLREVIFKNVEDVLNGEGITDEEKNKLVEDVIQLLSNNKFNSELNAALYSELIIKYRLFKNSIKLVKEKYDEDVTTIEAVLAHVDYEKFCKNNIKNDRRKAVGLFVVYLLKRRIIEKEYVFEKIKNFVDLLEKSIGEEEKKGEVEEISENIYLLLFNLKEELQNIEGYEMIIEKITTFSTLVVKEQKSFTSRAKFKLQDILKS